MSKSKMRMATALSAVLAVWAGVGISSSDAQPTATRPQTDPPPVIRLIPVAPAVPGDNLRGPIRQFIPGPPSARHVQAGWPSDDRTRMRVRAKAIQCGQLLDVQQQRVRQNVTIITNGERIVAIRDGLLRPSDVDTVIDLHDQVCAPGLMDMHLHLTSEFVRSGETDRPHDPMFFTVSETAMALGYARDQLYSGVTTMRTPAELIPNRSFAYLNNSIEQGHHPGPRIFMASFQIGRDYAKEAVIGAGTHYYERRQRSPVNVPYDHAVPGGDVRQAVREAIARGEQWVKLSLDVGGWLSFGMAHTRLWSPRELAEMADEAHKHGTRITAHIESDEATYDATMAGFDSVEHAYIPSRRTAEAMRDHHTYWSTTMVDFTMGHDATDPKLGDSPPLSRGRDTLDLMRQRAEAFHYAYSIGVPIVWASDGWVNPSQHRGRNTLEFSMYLALGVTPWDVLRFATVNPAAMLGESANLGSIDPGKYADIVAYPRNPLEDVMAYSEVNFVMKGGNVFRDDLHRSALPDPFVQQLPDVTYTIRNPREPFTPGNIVCTGRDC